MAEIRLSELIRQFNIGLTTLVDFLNENGADVNYNPNAKVSDEYLPLLEERFGVEKTPVIKPESAETSTTASIAPQTFGWNAFEKAADFYRAADREANKTAYDQILSKVNENEIVEGTVSAISKREVLVNIDYKSEGLIAAEEFRYNPDLKVGDKVEVYVEGYVVSTDDRRGQLILSHKKARQLRSWDMVNKAFDNAEVVKGYVKARTKGGMIVDVFGIEAFLPGSHIDIKPIRDYAVFVDTFMDFKIIKINKEFRNVVVSHKAILEDEVNRKRDAFFSTLMKGQVLEGKVKRIVDYGVFVDLGFIDGLIHINNLSGGSIKSLKEVASVGNTINVTVIDFNKDLQRISLGMKQTGKTPQINSLVDKTSAETFNLESIFNEKALEMFKKKVDD